MAVGWNGADPTLGLDEEDYELGTELIANVDITITHIRVWSPPEVNVWTPSGSRSGKLWNANTGAQVATVAMPDTLPTGWSAHELSPPVEVSAGTRLVVSYSTDGDYGFVAGAFASAVTSPDLAVTFPADADAVNGNGCFNLTPATFPNQSPGNAFYGVDITYVLGIGGNTAPTITALVVAANEFAATATVTAADAETLTGATYRFDWGDGTTDTAGSSATANHTYAAEGTYAVTAIVSDASGAYDATGAVVVITAPEDPGDLGPLARVRLAIVDAVNTVEGLHCFAFPPSPAAWKPGTCWPLWDGMEAADEGYRISTAAMNSWRLVVIVGSTTKTEAALSAIDDVLSSGILDTLVEADIGHVDAVRPATQPTDVGEPFAAVEITFRRES